MKAKGRREVGKVSNLVLGLLVMLYSLSVGGENVVIIAPIMQFTFMNARSR